MAAIKKNFRALPFTNADQRFHTLFTLLRDYRPHLHAFIEAVADFQFGSGVDDGIAKSFLRLTNCDRDRHSEAALASASEGAVADDLRGHGHVGVGKNDDVILGSALALRTVAVGSGSRINILRDRS